MPAPALKRVYAAPAASDGTRILVDRLWPRGIARDAGRIDLWLRDLAPSDGLRRRFHAKPDKWDTFCAAYARELEGAPAQAALKELRARLRAGRVTLLYAARDEEHNNAVALRAWLARRRPRR